MQEATPSSMLGGMRTFVCLNRYLPIYQGFYPPAQEKEKTRHKPAVVRKRRKDACKSCGITNAETAESLHYVPALNMTICSREYRTYGKSGHLKPDRDKHRIWALADHCESCGATDESLRRHPDLDITICCRDYRYYQHNDCLEPKRHVPKWEMADQCESCGTTDEPMSRHPDDSFRMTICNREYMYYKRNGVLCPEGVLARWEKADHCESCGATDVPLVRHPNKSLKMTICLREYWYHQHNGILNTKPPVKRRYWKKADRCESCWETEYLWSDIQMTLFI